MDVCMIRIFYLEGTELYRVQYSGEKTDLEQNCICLSKLFTKYIFNCI